MDVTGKSDKDKEKKEGDNMDCTQREDLRALAAWGWVQAHLICQSKGTQGVRNWQVKDMCFL